MQRPVRVLVCVLAAAVAAAPLAAAVYTIHLTNGNSFETRYEPEDASYDSGKVVFLDETGLLPHVNPGLLSADDVAALRKVSISQGVMLETISPRLGKRGGPHFGSPDKEPMSRLAGPHFQA